jgi:hypothetical protein
MNKMSIIIDLALGFGSAIAFWLAIIALPAIMELLK